ncbi:MAG: hypothetical protein ONB48_17520 [candidate division KSB1 bacterium]|nr:hypothetical protein [candidate division KSB1 bacterium]MDZ7275280.1 hypothetical protein [candidate division KSB1 bacterium]MDZ7287448.1 hypothetical protein [candidate division KSB1 bacterium]MDZ7299562.1 hypothetical protein [candidate division KSB1 bacterium]MDZ7308020.1 hypothetical protein [candidate division KSB1 bacterium]
MFSPTKDQGIPGFWVCKCRIGFWKLTGHPNTKKQGAYCPAHSGAFATQFLWQLASFQAKTDRSPKIDRKLVQTCHRDASPVRRLSSAQVNQVVAVLCDAFHHYPVMRYIIGPVDGDYDRRLHTLINFSSWRAGVTKLSVKQRESLKSSHRIIIST